jgi:hypothetical protein
MALNLCRRSGPLSLLNTRQVGGLNVKGALYLSFVMLIIAIASSRYYGDDYHVSLTSTCEPVVPPYRATAEPA